MSSPDQDLGRVLVPSTQEVFTQIPPNRDARPVESDEEPDADAQGSDWTHSPTSHSSRYLRRNEGKQSSRKCAKKTDKLTRPVNRQ